jgi:hypothetical protein
VAGRPSFAPTPEQRRSALALARLGISDREIARSLRIDRKTLARSELGYEVFDARLRLKVRLLRPIVKDALDHYGSSGPALLKRLDRSDVPDDTSSDAETDEKGAENGGNE